MDTWITITQDDILASINNPELTAALNTAPASGQDNILDTLISDVTAEVRGYVRRRNTLGQSGTLPQELKNAAIDIIIYRAANRLRKKAIAEEKKRTTTWRCENWKGWRTAAWPFPPRTIQRRK